MQTRIDRTVGPLIKPIKKLVFPQVKQAKLSNEIPLFCLPGGTQEIIKLEIVFKAGRSRELTKLAAKSTAAIIKEGTQNYSGEKLDNKIDYYGITISSASGMDTNSLVLFCLKKHLRVGLELLQEIIARPSFPEQELERYKKRSEERLIQELAKNDVISYRMITEKIYGKDHPYGYNSLPESYRSINLTEIKDHYRNFYNSNNCSVYLSGNIDDEVIKNVDQCLKQIPANITADKSYTKALVSTPETLEVKGNKLQNSIKIGRILFNRKHEDYPGFFLLNTILGGYFGARLMSNIREEKGYTYNIYSYLDQLEKEGSFYISTEVGNEYQTLTLDAIKDELIDLQENLVKPKELEMAKNYLMGNFLNMLDGPMKSSKFLKSMIENDLGLDFLGNMSDAILDSNAQEIRDLAQKHLDFEQMFKISVGDF